MSKVPPSKIANYLQGNNNWNRGNKLDQRWSMKPISRTPIKTLKRNRDEKDKKRSSKKSKLMNSDDEEVDKSDKLSKKYDKVIQEFKQILPLTHDHVDSLLADSKLDKWQLSALREILTGNRNTWISGTCGVGKTRVLRELSKILIKLSINHVVLSGTIDGAMDLNCLTVEKWCGFDSMRKIDQVLDSALLDLEKWILPELIIIDNVALVDKESFKIFEMAMSEIRKSSKVFGGATIIVASDAAQEPIFTEATFNEMFFEWPAWLACGFNVQVLQHNYLHTQESFDRIKRILLGQADEDCKYFMGCKSKRPGVAILQEISKLSQCFEEVKFIPNFTPIRLHFIGQMSEQKNADFAKKLQNRERMYVEFAAHIMVKNENWLSKQTLAKSKMFKEIMKDSHVPRILSLCTGLQVLLLEDIEVDIDTFNKRSIKRGSLGIITGWSEEIMTQLSTQAIRLPMVTFKEYPNLGSITIKPFEWINVEASTSYYQLPLRLGWVVSIFKRPQVAADSVYIEHQPLDGRQFYNAICKVRNSLLLCDFDPRWLKLDQRIVDFYRKYLVDEVQVLENSVEESKSQLT